MTDSVVMTAQRISQSFIDSYNEKFTEEIAMQFRKEHEDNCHHWDYTFLLWHRKFVNRFWQTIGLPRTYAVLTDEHDRELYSFLKKTILRQGRNFIFTEDSNKLNSFTLEDPRYYAAEHSGGYGL